jgi:hypothetical protein
MLPENCFRHCWRDAAKECEELAVENKMRLKPTTQILKFEDLFQITNIIFECNPSEEMLTSFSNALNIPSDQEGYEEKSFHIMSLLMKWVDTKKTKATKDSLLGILNELGEPFKKILLKLN